MKMWLAEEEQPYIHSYTGLGPVRGNPLFCSDWTPQLFPFRPRLEVVETVCSYTYTYRSKYSVQGQVLPPL